MNRPIELVSPGGNLEKLKTAVKYGADAVYTGFKKLSLRANAGNLSMDELKEAVDFAHTNNAKVYLATNIFSTNEELKEIKKISKIAFEIGVDAFIVSEPGALATIKETVPQAPVHISTQANVTNYKAAKIYASLGASRIILARELTLEEIKDIKEHAPEIEIEVFVHGAMCMAYSGRCLLSSYLTGRSSNKGDCSHSCRWKYYLVEEKRPGVLMPIEEDDRGTYIMNSKDLCALPILDRILEAGVDAIKIEGRMKSIYYTAVTALIYKKAIKLIKEDRNLFQSHIPDMMDELEKISHREYTTAFFNSDSQLQHYKTSGYIRKYSFLGILKGGIWEVRNKISVGEEVEILTPSGKIFKSTVRLMTKTGIHISEAHTNYKVNIKFDRELPIPDFSIIRKKLVSQ